MEDVSLEVIILLMVGIFYVFVLLEDVNFVSVGFKVFV